MDAWPLLLAVLLTACNRDPLSPFEGCLACDGLVDGYQVLLSAPLALGGTVVKTPYANKTRLDLTGPDAMTEMSNLTIPVPCRRLP